MPYDELVKRLREHNGWALNETLDEAADAIENMSEAYDKLSRHMDDLAALMPRWIPVSERLPEDECPVLVTYLGFHDHKPRANMLAYIYRDLGWCWWDDDIPGGVPCSVEITHWLPLPEPPKEE